MFLCKTLKYTKKNCVMFPKRNEKYKNYTTGKYQQNCVKMKNIHGKIREIQTARWRTWFTTGTTWTTTTFAISLGSILLNLYMRVARNRKVIPTNIYIFLNVVIAWQYNKWSQLNLQKLTNHFKSTASNLTFFINEHMV